MSHRSDSAAAVPRVLIAALLLSGAWSSDLIAQELPPEALPTAEGGEPINISPRGAFLRALAFPGWGHSAIGAHTRGGFYFLAETATAYTLIRTRMRLNEVNDRLAFRERFLRAQLEAEGVTEPTEIDARLEEDPALQELLSLQDSRGDQQEDMVALGIFLLLLSGADAYVSAHLSRFPEPLTVEAEPVGGGRIELGLRLTFHD